MSRSRAFHYPLQPVLLTRRWHFEQLQRDLGDLYAEIQEADTDQAALEARCRESHAAWEASAATEQNPQMYLRSHQHFQALDSEKLEIEERQAKLAERRELLIDALQQARRALDAVEAHRAQAKMQVERERLNKDYRETDDLWVMGAAFKGAA